MDCYRCSNCFFTFSSKSGLKQHEKKFHPEQANKNCLNYICYDNECKSSFSFMDQYINHLETIHKIDLGYQELSFNSFNEFSVWKDNIESSSRSRFVVHRGVSKKDKYSRQRYFCHRNGIASFHGKGIRKPKEQGTCKTTRSCPAVIIAVFHENGSCDIKYYSKHLDHDLDLKHVYLTKQEKLQIRLELEKANCDKDLLLSKLRSSSDDLQPTKINQIKKKDINNIMVQFKSYDFKQTIRVQSNVNRDHSYFNENLKIPTDHVKKFVDTIKENLNGKEELSNHHSFVDSPCEMPNILINILNSILNTVHWENISQEQFQNMVQYVENFNKIIPH